MDVAVAANDRRARETAEVGHARRDLEQFAAVVLTVPLLLSMDGVALPGWLALALATLEPASVLLGLIAVMDTVEPTVAASCLRPPRGDARNPGSSRALR